MKDMKAKIRPNVIFPKRLKGENEYGFNEYFLDNDNILIFEEEKTNEHGVFVDFKLINIKKENKN